MEEKEWFLYVVDHHEGPYSKDEIKKLVKRGEAKSSSYVWKEGYEDWLMMSDIADFELNGEGHGAPSFIVKPKAQTSAAPSGVVETVAPVSPVLSDSHVHTIGDTKPSDSVWCLSSRKIFSGPHSLKIIVRKINDGEASSKDLVWKEGWSQFVPISSIPEFMEGVKEHSGTLESVAKIKPSASAKALGLGGKPVAVKYRWYRSRSFSLLLLFCLLMGLYQSLVLGRLSPMLNLFGGGVSEKVAKLNLPLLPISLTPVRTVFIKSQPHIRLWIERGASYLPEPIREKISILPIPNTVHKRDHDRLREAAFSDFTVTGSRVAAALLDGAETNPSFVVTSNLADGTRLRVTLQGKEGTLLNAAGYDQSVSVVLNDHMGTTPPFMFDGEKVLPRGEYSLSVFLFDTKENALSTESYFLGGKKDAEYFARLKEYNERNDIKFKQAFAELTQIAETFESLINESAQNFSVLSAKPITKRKPEWLHFQQRFSKLSTQLKEQTAKTLMTGSATLLLAQKQLMQTQELGERLQALRNSYIERGGSQDAIKDLTMQLSASLNELKQITMRVKK